MVWPRLALSVLCACALSTLSRAAYVPQDFQSETLDEMRWSSMGIAMQSGCPAPF